MINDIRKNFEIHKKMPENQTSLETRMNVLTEIFNTQQSPGISGPNYQKNNQNQGGRDNYHCRYNNRGSSHVRYGNNYRVNFRGRNNYRVNYPGQNSSASSSNYNNYNSGSFR